MGNSLMEDVRLLKREYGFGGDIFVWRDNKLMIHPDISGSETDLEKRHMKRCKELRESWQTH